MIREIEERVPENQNERLIINFNERVEIVIRGIEYD